jgi:hypothetical protein
VNVNQEHIASIFGTEEYHDICIYLMRSGPSHHARKPILTASCAYLSTSRHMEELSGFMKLGVDIIGTVFVRTVCNSLAWRPAK